MRAIVFFLTLLVLCHTCPTYAREAYQLEVSDELRPLLELGLPPKEEADDTPQDVGTRVGLVRRLRKAIPELLATEGYFSPTIDIDIHADPILVSIQPGIRTKVAEVTLEFQGELSTNEVFAERIDSLRAHWLLPKDRYFRQEDWNTAKNKLLLATSIKSFPTAKIIDSIADIDPETSEAHLKVIIDSGQAYTLGPLKIEGLKDYDEALVARYNPLHMGEEYSLDRLLSLQSALQNTPYFSTVEVTIDTESGHPNKAQVLVRLSEAKPKRFTLSAGYSTNTGLRSEFTYRDANIFGNAWQLVSGASIEQKRQAIFADIYLPPEEEGHRHSFGGLYERTDINGLMTQRESVGVARTHTRGNISTRLGLSFQQEKSQVDGIDEPPTRLTTLALNWTWTQRNVDNPIDPHKGYVVSVQFGGASKAIISDSNFFRSYGRLLTYWPLSPNDVLQLRAEGGYTVAKSRDVVPEDFLFRTGGSQTVRGYGYLDLGVHEGNAIVGGRYMAVGSVEYTHWLDDHWGVASFIDAGNATDQLNGFTFKLGYGLGARWRSPAGPLALDLAYGQDDHTVRMHLSVAVAF